MGATLGKDSYDDSESHTTHSRCLNSRITPHSEKRVDHVFHLLVVVQVRSEQQVMEWRQTLHVARLHHFGVDLFFT